ncbi:type Z 30S ribosomal protein S14 [Candidatus Absconditicoccus praedator]|uniref:type Z 30S ribosomal protein S14 n=1 Tax=Candidatus Absconditicoccus praedator TaxID=2735562 RepID=UPI001E519568|nr:type Z 30S ribosomal protein S14 [Candidatus Absconditicoccus praedator]UFX82776.1 type Z 30S ribosomal protein S14 [Candidatus Absconditicoccus praedator]
MARKSLIVKQEKLDKLREKCIREGKKMKKPTKYYNRCKCCGRTRGYMREFGVCRICFRKYARAGMIMGVKKSSW